MRRVEKVAPTFHCLGSQSLVEAKVSDHNMLIFGTTIFLNMMMQGRWNAEKSRFNNGFAKVESDEDYQIRLILIIRILAEVLSLNPQITAIGLVEAPIKRADIEAVMKEAALHPSLKPFLASLIPENFTSWGVATLFNLDLLRITKRNPRSLGLSASFQDRIQYFHVANRDGKNPLTIFNMHLPFDIAKSKDPRSLTEAVGRLFLGKKQTPVLAMGDFNLHPEIMAKQVRGVRFFTQQDSSVLVKADQAGRVLGREFETVDGVLQSFPLQAKPYRDARSGLFAQLKPNLFSSSSDEETRLMRSANKVRKT